MVPAPYNFEAMRSVIIFFFLSAAALAQSNFATLSGRIDDPSPNRSITRE
jgi:hypothetical protein